jgi:hypothetical protein
MNKETHFPLEKAPNHCFLPDNGPECEIKQGAVGRTHFQLL